MAIQTVFSTTPTTLTPQASYTLVPGLTITPPAGDYLAVWVTGTTYTNPAGNELFNTALYVGGSILAHTERTLQFESSLDGSRQPIMGNSHITVNGSQAVEVRYTLSGSADCAANSRQLILFPKSNASFFQATATADATLDTATETLLTGMTLTPGAGTYLLTFSTTAYGPDPNLISFSVYVGGVKVAHTERTLLQELSIPDTETPVMIAAAITPTAGQAVEIRWARQAGAGTITALERTLTLMQVASTDIFQATATADSTSTSTTDAVISGMSITPGASDPMLALFTSSFQYGTIGVSPLTTFSFYTDATQMSGSEQATEHEASLDDCDLPVIVMAVTPALTGTRTVQWRSTETDTRTIHERTFVMVREATITGTGALASGDADVTGAGESGSSGTGALIAGGSDMTGSGENGSSGSGAMTSDAAAVSGSGESGSSGSGALASGDTDVTGAGESGSSGTGALIAGGSDMTGSGENGSSGSGAMTSDAAAVSGSGENGSSGSGAMTSDAAAVSGSGESGSSGSGALASGDTDVSGDGNVTWYATGALVSGDADVTGAGESGSSGSGALVSGDADVTGAGESGSSGSGALVSGDADVTGAGESGSSGSGALIAGAPAMAGSGESGSSGSGAMASGDAAVDGSGESGSSGSGALIAGNVVISAAGIVTWVATGALVAGNADVSGSGESGSTGTGALEADDADIDGMGVVRRVPVGFEITVQIPAEALAITVLTDFRGLTSTGF